MILKSWNIILYIIIFWTYEGNFTLLSIPVFNGYVPCPFFFWGKCLSWWPPVKYSSKGGLPPLSCWRLCCVCLHHSQCFPLEILFLMVPVKRYLLLVVPPPPFLGCSDPKVWTSVSLKELPRNRLYGRYKHPIIFYVCGIKTFLWVTTFALWPLLNTFIAKWYNAEVKCM